VAHTNHKHAPIYMKAIVDKHVSMNLVSLGKNLTLDNFEIWLDYAYDLN
jgi:hypothetical protein